jgi:hypothetical protein
MIMGCLPSERQTARTPGHRSIEAWKGWGKEIGGVKIEHLSLRETHFSTRVELLRTGL